MQLGFPNHPRRDVVREIDWIGTHGFDFVDLFLEPDCGAAEAVDPAAIRAALDRHALDVVGHLAWYIPIGSPMVQLRQAAVRAVADYLDVFAAVGVPAVTVHANWPSGMFDVDDGIGWQVESLAAILAEARSRNVRIMYELLGGWRDAPANIRQVLNELPDLLCHLDLGHCNLCGSSPEAMIRAFADRLHHIHLHDNNGQADLHLPPGTGTIDWPAVMQALREVGYDGTITLEIFSPDPDYALLALEKVRGWVDE